MPTSLESDSELLAATDDQIEEAVHAGDPMVLRGLLYQLTGDPMVAGTVTVDSTVSGSRFVTVTDPASLALIRARAVELLKSFRKAGPGEVPVGDPDRFRRSLSLAAGQDIAAPDVDLWLEELALDPWARGFEWPCQPSKDALRAFRVAVIGAGMGGLNAAVHLKRAGIPFFVLEMGADVGGTWYWNRYPGARVDSPSRTYTHTFAAGYRQDSEHCAQEENERYFNWVADTFDLRRFIEFKTEVKALTWQESTSTWEIVGEGPNGTRTWIANAVISAVGIFSRPNLPAIPGLEAFDGAVCHTSRWPQDLDLAGKRVAVIGSGCSGYQLVPAIAETTAHTYLFQRTPSWVRPVPGYLSPTRPEVAWLDRNLPYHLNFARFRTAWLTRPEALMATYRADPDFFDPHAASAANKQIRDASVRFLQTKFTDRPDLAEKMLPSVPPGSSRPVLVDTDCSVYDMLLRDDVTLVTEPIERVTGRGIVVGDGTEHPADVIVLATGFKTNEYLLPIEVRGCSGADLQRFWSKDGPRAYLGTMVPSFPNFFMLYGPNTNGLGGLGIVEFEEIIVRFTLQCLAWLILNGQQAIDVRADAYWRFNERQDRADALQVYNFDKRVRSYYTSPYGRSVTNSALDIRVFWNWLRDPLRDPSTTGGPTIEQRLAEVSSDLAEIARYAEPYIGKDLLVG